MKKLVVTIMFFLLFFQFSLFGQTVESKSKSFFDFVEFKAGIKAGSGAEFWTTPGSQTMYKDADSGEEFKLPFFDETRSGYNITFGFFGEITFIKHIALEVGAYFVRHKILEDTDWSYTEITNNNVSVYNTHSVENITFVKLRIPILVKGILPVGQNVRLSFGVGPEFGIPIYSSAYYNPPSAVKGNLQKNFKGFTTEEASDIGLATAFTVNIKAGKAWIPITLKYTYNFSQSSEYQHRIVYDQLPPNGYPTLGTIKTRNSMYLQLLIGLAYEF